MGVRAIIKPWFQTQPPGIFCISGIFVCLLTKADEGQDGAEASGFKVSLFFSYASILESNLLIPVPMSCDRACNPMFFIESSDPQISVPM